MSRIKNILSLNKSALLVTTSLVVAGCTTADPQNQSADTSFEPAQTNPQAAMSEKGLSQQRLMKIASRAWENGNPGTALRLYNMALQKNPKAEAPYLAMADILRKTKRPEAAIDIYKGLLNDNPKSLEAHRGIGYSLLALDKPYLASQSFEVAIALDPSNAKTLGGMAVALDTAGEHEKAQDYYRHAIKADPNNLTYQNNLALSLALIGRIEQAIAMLEIITAHPDATAKHRQNLALVYGMAGKSADAMRYSRMDLNEKDARNNALYFQALNSTPSSQVTQQDQQKQKMALTKRTPIVTAKTDKDQSVLVARTGVEVISTHATARTEREQSRPESQQRQRPKILPPPASDYVQYAEAPKPAYVAMAEAVQAEEYASIAAAAPVGEILAETLTVPAESLKTASTAPQNRAPIAFHSRPGQYQMLSLDIPSSGLYSTASEENSLSVAASNLDQTPQAIVNTPEQMTYGHGYYAQVGAFRTEERALNAWQMLVKKHPSVLGGYEPVFAKADLGEEKGGTFYRVRVGGFVQKSIPLNLCMTLRNLDLDCYMPPAAVSGPFDIAQPIITAPTQEETEKASNRYNVASISY